MRKKILLRNVSLLTLLLFGSLFNACDDKVTPEPGRGVITINSSIDLSLGKASFGGEGGSFIIKVNHNIDYSVDIPEEWIEIEEGNEPSEYQITILRNNSAAEREGMVIFLGSDEVTQAELAIIQGPGKTLASFAFKAEHNPDCLTEDLVLTIEDNKITGRIPHYTDLTNLVASFEGNFSAVKVNQTEQESGITPNNFRKPLTYSFLSKSGETVTYLVELTHFTGLPVMLITTETGEEVTSKEDYLDARIVIDGMGVFPDMDEAVQIKGRGNSTWVLPKKPYRLKFDKKKSVLGFPEHKSWVLLANHLDKSALRNELSFDMSRYSNLAWTPRTQFVELFFNGRYDGTYQLTEMIKIATDRVNVSDDGFVIEVDSPTRIEPEDIFFTTPLVHFVIKDPDVVTGDTHYTFIANYVNAAETALYGDDFLDADNGYKQYIDLESFADWYLINEITKNNDAIFFSSCYMNYAPGGKLMMGPVWDYDLALGNYAAFSQTPGMGIDNPEGFYIKNSLWIARMFEDPEFIELVKTRYAAMRAYIPLIIINLNENADYLHGAVIENNIRWKTLRTETFPYEPVWAAYQSHVDKVKEWLNARLTWMDGAISAL